MIFNRVGELGFKRARPKEPWDGVFDGKEYGPAPIQFQEEEAKGSEDCLTLNIQRPCEGDNLLVFVWIYGGGYNIGAASEPLHNGLAFARDGLVFVSIQYRLNVLGFYDFTTYADCEDFESNCGLSDQILALKWVHENIKAFGGDPTLVTIAGESAGGVSVINLLAGVYVIARIFCQAVISEESIKNTGGGRPLSLIIACLFIFVCQNT